ncbi:hypothetical protein N7490_000709 [Penicillium lividum]|nr:hypothetical protein N7490_000709 [Penicillium lividum]
MADTSSDGVDRPRPGETLSSDEEDFVSSQHTPSMDSEGLVKRHLSSFRGLKLEESSEESSDRSATRTITPGNAFSIYTASSFKPTAKNPMQLLELPLDILKDIIKEVTHTNDLTSLALTCSTLHGLTIPHMYSRFDIVWPESLNASSEEYTGVDALSYGLSTLVMGEDVFHHALFQQSLMEKIDRRSGDCSRCGCNNPNHHAYQSRAIDGTLRRRGNHYAQYTRTFSIGNGPLSWVQEYSVNREVGKMLGTLVALAVSRMINLEAFIWDMPTGVVREIWLALASLADTHDRGRLERIWVRWHDNSDNLQRISTLPSSASRRLQKYKHVEHPSLSVLPPLKSVTVLDIDETAYVEELAVLIERSRHRLVELRIGVSLKAHLSPWLVCTKDTDPPIDSNVSWPRAGGILSILSQNYSVLEEDAVSSSAVSPSTSDSLQSDASTENDDKSEDQIAGQGTNSPSSLHERTPKRAHHRAPPSLPSSSITTPKAIGSIHGVQSNEEKLKLEVLELERVPISVSNLLPQLDWTRLTTLTLMRCDEHENLWRALRRKYAPPPLPQKRAQKEQSRRSSFTRDDYPLNIKHLRTDTVTQYMMLFIKDTLAPNTLESVYFHEAPNFDSGVNTEAIYRHILRKHRLSLRRILIEATDRDGNVDGLNASWHKWMFNQEMISFVTSGRMPQLRELGMAMHYRDWHYFLQRLPKISKLHALYLPHISHSIHRDMKEMALQVLDIVSICPDLKITYIGLQSKCYQILETNGPSNHIHSDASQSPNSHSDSDGLAAFDDDSIDASNDEDDLPVDNPDIITTDISDESESELEENGNSHVHFKLQEILFYDDKISIFKARRGVI